MLKVQGGACALMLVACGDLSSAAPDAREVGVSSQALSGCDEMVPANRYIDGVPAYAQCTASNDSAIYSNNGIDTSLTSMGSDWVKTQYSGGYQCTELAHRYLYFRWNVKWIPNGNAGLWCDTQPPANSGVVQTMVPVHGDVMVLAPGSCGASADTGHVNLIDTVDMAAGKVVAVEQNQAGRHTYNTSCGKCFLHVMANDGTPMPIKGATTPPATAAGSGATAAAGRPAVPPTTMTGAAGRPGAAMPPARAGAAAPVITPPPPGPSMLQPVAAGTAAVTTPPSMMAPPVTPLANPNALAAGSAAPATITRPAAPAAEGCTVARVGESGSSSAGLVFTLALGLGLGVRRRRAS